MLTHIDLFSGIGGFALAARWAGFRTVAFCEIEPYAQEILKQNFGAVANAEYERCVGSEEQPHKRDGSSSECDGQRLWDGSTGSGAPILYSDVFTFNGTRYRGATLLTGGFPCQPFSQAGKRRGKEDDRYLWPEMLRVIHEARPAWLLGENVAGIVTMELDRVLSDLEGENYACQSFIIPACAVDAKHRRDRVWIVGHAEQFRRSKNGRRMHSELCREAKAEDGMGGGETLGAGFMVDTEDPDWGWSSGTNDKGWRDSEIRRRRKQSRGIQHWLPEPEFCGMVDGLSEKLDEVGGFYSYEKEWEGIPRVATGVKNRVDRLKGLGNSIQPQVAYEILKVIYDIESTYKS